MTGGQALELYTGKSWRAHRDLDIGFIRSDAPLLFAFLREWERYVFAAGVVREWHGGTPDRQRAENNVWCRRSSQEPWYLDFTANDGDGHSWLDTTDRMVRVPWEKAVLRSASGIPFLAPELALLAKSGDVRRKDDIDATLVSAHLDEDRRARLQAMLPADHGWQALLRST